MSAKPRSGAHAGLHREWPLWPQHGPNDEHGHSQEDKLWQPNGWHHQPTRAACARGPEASTGAPTCPEQASTYLR